MVNFLSRSTLLHCWRAMSGNLLLYQLYKCFLVKVETRCPYFIRTFTMCSIRPCFSNMRKHMQLLIFMTFKDIMFYSYYDEYLFSLVLLFILAETHTKKSVFCSIFIRVSTGVNG